MRILCYSDYVTLVSISFHATLFGQSEQVVSS